MNTSEGILVLGLFLAVVIIILLLLIWSWFKYPWKRVIFKSIYNPSSNTSNRLGDLINLLCDVNSWLGPGNNPISPGLQKGLWEQINYLKIEQDACTAIFSTDDNERIWAIRRLSEYKTKRVIAVIQRISKHEQTREEIRELAKETLKQHHENQIQSRIRRHVIPETRKKSWPEIPILYSNTTTINMEQPMVKNDGDTYHVNQAGAVGPNAEAHHFQMTQNFGNELENIDANALAKELEVLRVELKRIAKSPEQDMAVGAIAAAEVEIKRGDITKAKEYLKQAGKWAFDVATKIGIGLATAALKASLGL